MVAFDSMFLMLFLSDIIRSCVKINKLKSSTVDTLRNAEVDAAFMLSELYDADAVERVCVKDAVVQLAAVRRYA